MTSSYSSGHSRVGATWGMVTGVTQLLPPQLLTQHFWSASQSLSLSQVLAHIPATLSSITGHERNGDASMGSGSMDE